MTDHIAADALSPIKRALLDIRELKAQLARAHDARSEPIAIVGMGLRFPGGAHDAESFAALLWSGTDAIVEIPGDRWSLDTLFDEDPDAPGKMTTRFGGFVDGVDRFDAEFFGISPREAASMDPQQRLVLEVAWEALENAGQSPSALAGSSTGVYLGVSNNDYGRGLFSDRSSIDPYFSTGNAYSVVAGRLSYFLGLRGPSIAIDTACSSSLVALHLACQGLRLGECDTALTGAVNLILSPELNINFSRARMMSRDGRCKTFDAAADGYVRSEGCGVLVLRRLSDATKNRDRVLAIIRGSALNQDGRSGGLTAPNGPAQEAVIRAALKASQVPGNAVSYVETHGTGTSLGDPIEVGALGAVLAADRDRRTPLVIGSVKTNIGHLEAAAGVAGIIKVVLCMQRGEIPPHLHYRTGNPHIDWSLPIQVPTTTMPWAPLNGRRIAGVSSFGFSGTNAHVILEEAPALEEASTETAADRPRHVLALSARTDTALADVARGYVTAVDSAPVADVCFTANAGRSHYGHRLCVVGSSARDFEQGLESFVDGHEAAGVVAAHADGALRPQVAFLFTGQGAQYAGMGRVLYDSSPVFRSALDECAVRLKPLIGRDLFDVIFATADKSPINDTVYAQPATFAIEYALAKLWRSWGIEPAAVLGHSLGEYAAACVAGVFSLDDGIRLVAERGRLTHELPGDGAMGAIFAPESIVMEEVARNSGAISIAAYNGPEHFVVSGLRPAIEAALARQEAAGVRVKMLRVPHAAHSNLIEPALPALGKVLESVSFQAPEVALVSNLTGGVAGLDEIGRVQYWLDHMRQPVRFAPAMQSLHAQGITHYIEVGPHPVLLGMGAECVLAPASAWLPSLHRERADWTDLLESVQRLYVDGSEVDWNGFDRGYKRHRVALPTYPFQRRRHWTDATHTAAGLASTDRWPGVQRALDQSSERGPLDLNAGSYPAKWDCLRRITLAHALRVLRQAGLFAESGERHTLEELLQTAGIGESYRHLLQRWLDGLTKEGMLTVDGTGWRAVAPLPVDNLPQLWQEAEQLFADNQPLLNYVRHCGGLVGDVLTGKESPLETLFPGGSFELAENLYQRSSMMRYINGVASAALEVLAGAVPAGGVLRVLEVGAGTGGTTSALLPVLPADKARYRYTDVSEIFLDRARSRFGEYAFVDYGLFDIERDGAEQGYTAASFDVIVSANAVHASTDVRRALARLRELLSPGGVLILVESTIHLDWFDMTTGLIEGWQHFSDDLRRDNPLMPPQTWVAALLDAGFDRAGAWPAAGSSAEILGQHVVAARVPGEVRLVTAAESAQEFALPILPGRGAARPDDADQWRARLADAVPSERAEVLRDLVRTKVMAVLRLDASSAPARHDRLMDLGMDSLMAVQLRNALGTSLSLQRPLPSSLMFDYPTIDAIAAHLLDRLAAGTAGAPGASDSATAVALPVLGSQAVAQMSDEEIAKVLLKQLGGA